MAICGWLSRGGDEMGAIARRSLRVAGVAVIAALIGFSAGCSNLKMPVPAELAEVSEELPVTGRSRFAGFPGVGESFQMGPYGISGIDRESTFSTGLSILGLSRKRVIGGYTYLFRGSKNERKAECAIEAAEEKISLPGTPVSVGRARGTLGCVCHGSQGASSMVMPLSHEAKWLLGGTGKSHRGQLRSGRRDFSITAIFKTEQKGFNYVAGEGWSDTVLVPSSSPTGCLAYGDGPVGGLELVHPGRAWFARSLDATEREDMACLFAALLLYEPP